MYRPGGIRGASAVLSKHRLESARMGFKVAEAEAMGDEERLSKCRQTNKAGDAEVGAVAR